MDFWISFLIYLLRLAARLFFFFFFFFLPPALLLLLFFCGPALWFLDWGDPSVAVWLEKQKVKRLHLLITWPKFNKHCKLHFQTMSFTCNSLTWVADVFSEGCFSLWFHKLDVLTSSLCGISDRHPVNVSGSTPVETAELLLILPCSLLSLLLVLGLCRQITQQCAGSACLIRKWPWALHLPQ